MDTPPSERRSRNWLAILAFIISVGSLAVSAGSFFVSRSYYDAVTTHYKLTVQPYVNITVHLSGPNGKNGFYVSNDGLGPAFVRKFWAEGGGRSYDGFNKSFWRNMISDLNSWKNYNIIPRCFKEIFVQPNNVLKPGDEKQIFAPTLSNLPECNLGLLRFLEAFRARGLKMYMEYVSIYDEPRIAIGESWVDQEIAEEATTPFKAQPPQKP